MKRVMITIRGKVQGVGFRYSALQKANALGVTGYVSNRDDGAVEILAQGAFPAVDQLIHWCETGPANAKVDSVFVDEDEADEIYLDFSITV
ncbi:MAG: acylphosphatase [Shewanella sp.]|uniref:acylphosphatase n=1 Tax=Shewanella sp. 4t3-1-2LB TaxID=2817682 RepID=UPI001A97EDDC|nr:acylphosphatase [Shewanella sp. 4t3-1-2LB]MBO1273407.1 acylphosphatase [Shewanella sp. 4t3-1-2LB]MCD8475254.1 acylphosphatase [Shewanella fodinae]MDN5370717.1 acylphosphatase [Shewanella sp.]